MRNPAGGRWKSPEKLSFSGRGQGDSVPLRNPRALGTEPSVAENLFEPTVPSVHPHTERAAAIFGGLDS